MTRADANALTSALKAAGLPGSLPAAIVESASLPEGRQLPCTLDELPQRVGETSGGPALVILGEVLRETVQALDIELQGIQKSQRTAG